MANGFLKLFLEGSNVFDVNERLNKELAGEPNDRIADLLGMVPEGIGVSRCPVKSAIMHEGHGGPKRWVRIAQIALGDASGDERSATFLLEVVDGARRVNVDLSLIGAREHAAELVALVDKNLALAKQCIDRLPDGARKRELAVLWGYHVAIIQIAKGDLAGAAEGYDMQAAAATDLVIKAQAAHMAAWCRMMAATYWDKEARGIRMKPGLLEAYCAAGTNLLAASHGTDDGPRLRGNFIANAVLGYWLANAWTSVAAELSMKVDDFQRLVEPPHNLRAALGDGLRLARILRDYHEAPRGSAQINAVQLGEDGAVSIEWRLWGYVLAAVIDLNDSNFWNSSHSLHAAVDCPGVGGATARRLAKDILDAEQPKEAAGD